MATITRSEFLDEYKPEHPIWARDGEKETPSEGRILTGWVVEQPKHTVFNWHMNRTDNRLVLLEAKVAWLEKCLERLIAESSY